MERRRNIAVSPFFATLIMKEITTDNFSFEDLRKRVSLYVDKTQYIWSLVSGGTKIYFLSRPRRFGKSLLLSTLEAFFLNKRELFKDLAIDTLAPDDVWQDWPVVHLDMAQASSFDGLEETKLAMVNYLTDVAKEYGVELSGNELPKDLLRRMILHLNKTTGKQVVVLIDEYDKPILDAIHKPYVTDVVGMMQNFYQELKSNVDIERFVFITGVTKFAHTSLFSGANNPTDITQESEFATMLGYTEQELRSNFAEHIDATAQTLKMDREALIVKMKVWYDGFRFTSDTAHVFNPVSVGKFFRNKKFMNYWFATGTPTFLVNLMKNDPFQLENFTSEWTSPVYMDKYNATNLEPKALALQTGYLTIADVVSDEYGESYRYDFPNEEIRMSWNDCMLDLASSNYMQLSGGRRILYDALRDGNIDAIMQLLKSLFGGVTKDKLGDVWDGYYRNMMYMLFTAFGIDVHSEEQVAGGIVDIVVKAYDQAYVFELKVSRMGTESDIAKCLENGIDQALTKHYADKYHFDASKAHVVSMVFEHNDHQLVAWREER